MQLLLDENLPKRLKKDLVGHVVFTIREKGWAGKSNGELMKLIIAEKIDALITFDKNLQYQQNFKQYTLAVIVLNAADNSYITLKNLVPKILTCIDAGLKPGANEVKL